MLLARCWIDDDWDLTDAKARAIEAPRCRLRSIHAGQLGVDGALDFSHSSIISLVIPGARVAGLVNLSGTKLDNTTGTALQAENLIATQTMSCASIRVSGEAVLLGASVGGALILDGATLDNPSGTALLGNRLTVAHWMSCDDGFTATGEVSLVGAVVGSGLSFTKAQLNNPGGWALNAQGINVGYGLFLGSAVDRRGKFHATGGVRLNGARIGGFVCAWDATLDSPNGIALVASGIRVAQDMMLDRSFVATGEVILSNAQIGTTLALDRAQLRNPGRVALTAERLVADSIRCRDGFTNRGTLNLSGAQVAGRVDLTGAVLDNDRDAPLILAALQAGSLTLRPATPPHEVDLRHAKVGAYRDDPTTWPQAMHLRDFVYDTLDDHDRHTAKRRLDWIRRDPDGYSPQPYEHLAALLRRRGQDDAARKVAMTRRSRQRTATKNPLRKAWNWFLYATVGYGYRASQALIWLVVLFIVGSVVFDAPVAAHAADDAVDGWPRQPSALPGRAASASTGGFRHRISGIGIGAIAIAWTSTSVRV